MLFVPECELRMLWSICRYIVATQTILFGMLSNQPKIKCDQSVCPRVCVRCACIGDVSHPDFHGILK